MKRVLTLMMTVILIAVMLILPGGSLAASKPKTPSISKLSPEVNSINVSWKAVDGVRGYEVRWGKTNTLGWDYSSTTGTSMTVSGLKPDTKYTFQIRAYYKNKSKTKYTSWSSKKYAVTKPVDGEGRPRVPSINSLTYSNNAVTVSWGADSNAAGFEVSWGEKGPTPWGDPVETSATSMTVTSGLIKGSTMAFRVRAFWWNGSNLNFTSWSDTKYLDIPGVPTPSINAYANSDGTATVEWSPSSEANGYEINWGKKGWEYGWPYNTYSSSGKVTVSQGLEVGSTYAFRVRGYYTQDGCTKYTSWSETKYVSVYKNAGGYWTSWSDWTTSRKTVTTGMEEEKGSHWWAAKCKSCGQHNPYWGKSTKCRKCGKYLSSGQTQHMNIYLPGKNATQTLLGRNDGIIYNGLYYWYCEPAYRYRYWISN